MKKALTLLFLAVLVVSGFIPMRVLIIKDMRQGRAVFMEKVSPGDTFSLTFIHSVEKSPVTDYFKIDDARGIVLYETEFSSLNTGLPATISEGQTLLRTDRGFRLSIPDRIIPEIQLWVDSQYAGALNIDKKQVILAGLAGNTLLQIKLMKISLWRYIFKVTV